MDHGLWITNGERCLPCPLLDSRRGGSSTVGTTAGSDYYRVHRRQCTQRGTMQLIHLTRSEPPLA